MLFFLGGIIFWCLAILAFREYRRLKFKNDLFLALFFLSIGWLFPIVLVFPYSSPDPPTLFIGVGANLLISIGIVFMNLFPSKKYKLLFNKLICERNRRGMPRRIGRIQKRDCLCLREIFQFSSSQIFKDFIILPIGS